MIYLFGNHERLAAYNIELKNIKKLSLRSIFKLSNKDLIFITKAWSPLVALIYQRKNRPKIIQFADGLITEANCNKRLNKIPHLLYEKIYADALYVRQDINSLPSHINTERVKTIVSHKTYLKEVSFNSILFVFGNDPFVGSSLKNITRELKALKEDFNFKIPINFSSKNKKIIALMSDIFPNSNNIGLFKKYSKNFEETIIISTPSTVVYDCALNGMNTLMFNGYTCSTMHKLFSSTDTIQKSKVGSNMFTADVFDYIDTEKYSFLIPKKEHINFIKLRPSYVGFKRFIKDILSLAIDK